MRDPADLVPMRWPASWRDPARLDLLKGTPINCLLMPGEDRELHAVRERAAGIGLKCLTAAGADAPAAPQQVRILPRSTVDWRAADSILAVSECVWPAVAGGSGGAQAGPTGVPWVDSNGWFVQLLRTLAPGKPLWLVFEPPEKTVVRAEAYALAVADCEAYGGRWVIALDAAAESDATGARQALEAAGRALRFFEKQARWRAFVPRAVLGVLSDFAGENREVGYELLNLLARRPLPFRVLEKRPGAMPALTGLKAVVYPDQQAPEPPLRERLLAFVRSGGLLVSGPHWGGAEGVEAPGDVYGRFTVRRVGSGRLAVAKEELSDPYLAALDVHLLLGHEHDLVRLWNGGSLNVHYTAPEAGGEALLQLVNYTTRRAAHPVTVGLTERYRAARFWRLDAATPEPLKIERAARGIELPLPEFSVYAAIELEVNA